MAKLFVLPALLALCGCLVVETNYDKLPPGPYRAILYLDGRQSERREPDDVVENYRLDDVARGELPFQLEFDYTERGALFATVVNGEERIRVDSVEFERLIDLARDSITLHFPLNDSYVTAYHDGGIVEGTYVDETRDEGLYRIPFAAFFGEGARFTDLAKAPAVDLEGTWAVTFGVEDSTNAYPAVAEFEQRGNDLTGTFRTTTGDYRYLAGTIQGERAYLSTFDGGHAFLFTAKLQSDGSLLGIFRSGTHYSTLWSARRDSSATLPPADELSAVTGPDAVLDATLLDPRSLERYSLAERRGSGAELYVLTLMGSWCPNCMDEALFLDSLRATLPGDRVEVQGLSYEKFRDSARAVAAVNRFSDRLGIGFPIGIAGYADKAEATAALGVLDEVRSFPTLIITDSGGRVRYVHSGFDGPATSRYGTFAKEFAATVKTLLDS